MNISEKVFLLRQRAQTLPPTLDFVNRLLVLTTSGRNMCHRKRQNGLRIAKKSTVQICRIAQCLPRDMVHLSLNQNGKWS